MSPDSVVEIAQAELSSKPLSVMVGLRLEIASKIASGGSRAIDGNNM